MTTCFLIRRIPEETKVLRLQAAKLQLDFVRTPGCKHPKPRLALPQYSESILGWGLYTLVVTALMPLVRYKLERRCFSSRAVRMSRLLLMGMTGTVVGTSWSGLVALVFPHVADFASPGPTGITLALGITAVFVAGQTILEKQLQEIPDPQTPENSYGGAVRTILLNCLWSTLGYFWNSVWNRVVKRMRHGTGPKPPARPVSLASDALPGLETWWRRLGQRDGPLHRFATLQDEMNGRPEKLDTDGPGYRMILVKAAAGLHHSCTLCPSFYVRQRVLTHTAGHYADCGRRAYCDTPCAGALCFACYCQKLLEHPRPSVAFLLA